MRKLRLLPEVLPDPTAKAAEGSPRARTVRHMQRLLAMAAATSAIACTKEGEPGIRKETEATTKKATPDPAVTATATATASVSAEPDPTTGPGYGVVDPMPPPAKCKGAAASIKATGVWKTDKSGTYVEVKMPKPTMPDTKYDRKDPPYASGGKIAHTTFVGDDLVLRVLPDAGSTTVWVYTSVTCTAGPEHISLQIDISAGKTPGSSVKIDLYDQY